MKLTDEENKKLIEFYFNTKSIVKAQRAYQRHFGVKAAPDQKALWRIAKKFQTNGTDHNLNKERSGSRRDDKTLKNIDAVRCSVIQRPIKSSRRRFQELGMSRMSIVRIL